MKLFGTLSELVKIVFRSGNREIKLNAAPQTGSQTDVTFQLPDLANNSETAVIATIVEKDLAQDVANKSLISAKIPLAGSLRFEDDAISGPKKYVDVKSPTLLDTNWTLTLPKQPGSSGTKYVLANAAGDGETSWLRYESSNQNNAIVQRDSSGNFSAGTITATLSGNATNVTGIVAPANGGTGLSALGTGVATFLGTPSSANLASAVTDETGSGSLVFGTNPVISSPTVRGDLLLQNSTGAQPTLQLSEDPDNGTNKVVVQAPASLAADYTLTLPTDDGNSGQVLSTDGSGVLSWASAATVPTGGMVYSDGSALQTTGTFAGNGNEIVGVNSGGTAPEYKALSVGTTGTDFAIAHSVGGVAFNLPDASATARGVVTTGTQTIAGAKTLSSALTITPTSNQVVLGTTRTVTITAPTPATSSRTHTIPDVSADASFVMTQGNQTIAGDKTFSGNLISDNLQASSGSGLTFKENGGTTIGTVGDTGSWTLGTTAKTQLHFVYGVTLCYDDSSNPLVVRTDLASGTARQVVRFQLDGMTATESGGITATSNAVSPAFYTGTSDERLKEGIETAPFDALNKLNQIRLVDFWMKGETNKPKIRGVIAQELQQVYPEKVMENPDTGYLSVCGGYEYDLIQAVQELSSQIESLKAEIEVLKNK